jgi:hypothetical protein
MYLGVTADSEKIKNSLEGLVFRIAGDHKDHNDLNPRRSTPFFIMRFLLYKIHEFCT